MLFLRLVENLTLSKTTYIGIQLVTGITIVCLFLFSFVLLPFFCRRKSIVNVCGIMSTYVRNLSSFMSNSMQSLITDRELNFHRRSIFDGKPCKWHIIMKPFFFTQPKYFGADVLSILSVGPWFCSFNNVLAIAFHF